MNELKPCPFCGGQCIFVVKDWGEKNRVACLDCGVKTPYLPGNEAIERWNRRVNE